MTVYWQQSFDAPVEKITAGGDYYWSAMGDQFDRCEDADCACNGLRTNQYFLDDSEAKAIIGLIQEHYDNRS